VQIDDVQPGREHVSTDLLPRTDQSVSGKGLCVAISPDGARAYLGGHSGVWRSDDGGDTWWHPDWLPEVRGGPTPEQALRMTNVYDLFISPGNSDVVLASTGRDRRLTSLAGIYRTENGDSAGAGCISSLRCPAGPPRSGSQARSSPPRTTRARSMWPATWP
jgi:hypothetical protein